MVKPFAVFVLKDHFDSVWPFALYPFEADSEQETDVEYRWHLGCLYHVCTARDDMREARRLQPDVFGKQGIVEFGHTPRIAER